MQHRQQQEEEQQQQRPQLLQGQRGSSADMEIKGSDTAPGQPEAVPGTLEGINPSPFRAADKSASGGGSGGGVVVVSDVGGGGGGRGGGGGGGGGIGVGGGVGTGGGEGGLTIQQLFEDLPPVVPRSVSATAATTPSNHHHHNHHSTTNTIHHYHHHQYLHLYPHQLHHDRRHIVSDSPGNVGGSRHAQHRGSSSDAVAAASVQSFGPHAGQQQQHQQQLPATKLSVAPPETASASSSSVDPPQLRHHASATAATATTATSTTTAAATSTTAVNSRSSASIRKWYSDVDSLVVPPRTAASRSQSRGSSVGTREGRGVALGPQPGLLVLKQHASDLTDWERTEIKLYKMVYYLGLMSAKRQARLEASKQDGFDDKEGFYVCKPRDHLLYRYEIVAILGKGTFGQVVKAWDHKTKSLVALKIVKNERPFLRQAREEVRLLELLSRQDKNDVFNTVHILDHFQFRGHVCIAFELLGISLHQLLKKTRGQGFSVSRVQKLTRGVLRCLDLLAKNRIIHCDIKPENILLRRSAPGHSAVIGANFSDSSIKVIDFGSSCYEQQQLYTYIQSRYYRAPDVILGQRYTCAIDMWSLACVVAELITAAPLFAGDDEHDQMAAIIELIGVPPKSLATRCKRWDKFFTGQNPRYITQHVIKGVRGPPASRSLQDALGHTDDVAFVDFMLKALNWDPAARLTAAQALRHPWMMRGQGCKSAPAVRNHVKIVAKMDPSKAKSKPGRGKSTTAVNTVANTNTTKAASSTTAANNNTIAGTKGPKASNRKDAAVSDDSGTQRDKKQGTANSQKTPP